MKTRDERIAELRKDIETIDFIAARCTTDNQARAYEQNRREKVTELVKLENEVAAEAGFNTIHTDSGNKPK